MLYYNLSSNLYMLFIGNNILDNFYIAGMKYVYI